MHMQNQIIATTLSGHEFYHASMHGAARIIAHQQLLTN